jgi:4-diphosphocytidyl-2-C-methyl-D-erythritol kinase
MILTAKAKINLYLHVINKDLNNYHNIQSLVCFADDIYDNIDIKISKSNSHEILFFGEFASQVDSHDLILKTLKYLPIKYCYKIKITKNIPVAAGLGGGSADVAAIIKYIIAKEKIILTQQELQDICLALGADIHCCYYSKIANIEQYGEKISPVIFDSSLYALLVNPMIKLSTKDIFNNLVLTDNCDEVISAGEFKNSSQLIDFVRNNRNDLESVASEMVSDIANIIAMLDSETNSLLSRMTGSGSTCFALFSNKADCFEAYQISKKLFPKYWCRYTSLT